MSITTGNVGGSSNSGNGGGGNGGGELPDPVSPLEIANANSDQIRSYTPSDILNFVETHKKLDEIDYISPTITPDLINGFDYHITTNSFNDNSKLRLFSFGDTGTGSVNITLDDDINIPDSFIVQTSIDSLINIISGGDNITFTPESPSILHKGQSAIFRRNSNSIWSITTNTGMAERQVLNHISYDENNERVVFDVALSTTLSTVWLSDQWGFKSGGKSVFFSSTDQSTNFSPIMRGIKTQAIPENRDSSGIVKPFYRKYGDELLQGSLKGAMNTNTSAIAPYEGISTLTSDIAVFGVRAILGENLTLGDKLWYRLWYGSDDSGYKIFEQSITVSENRLPNFDFTGWWSAPAEAFANDVVFARISVVPIDGSPERTLMVRATEEDDSIHWNELQFRTFNDVEIKTEFSSPYIAKHNGPYTADVQTVLNILPTEGSKIFDIDLENLPDGEGEIDFSLYTERNEAINISFKIVLPNILADDTVVFPSNHADVIDSINYIIRLDNIINDYPNIINTFKFKKHDGRFIYNNVHGTGFHNVTTTDTVRSFLIADNPKITLWAHNGATGIRENELDVISYKFKEF